MITYYCTDKHDKVTVDVAHIKEVEQEIKAAPKVALFLPKSSYIKKSFTPKRGCLFRDNPFVLGCKSDRSILPRLRRAPPFAAPQGANIGGF